MNEKKAKLMRKAIAAYIGGKDHPRFREMYRYGKKLQRIIKLHRPMGYLPSAETMYQQRVANERKQR